MDEELKPCPFCGSTARVEGDEVDGILCGGCGFWYRFEGYTDSREAVAFWNRRPVEDALRAENERLRETMRPIPMTERRPQTGDHVLLWHSTWAMWMNATIGGDPTDIHDDYTHWMPIPPPPQDA